MPSGPAFRHDAVFYRGSDDLARQVVPFLADGAERGAAILVLVPKVHHDVLRVSLGATADAMTFADMDEVGRDPADLLPLWRWFVDAHADSDRPMRGVAEPIGPARTPAQVAACERNEAVFTATFGHVSSFEMLCPYDLSALDRSVIERARRNHPIITPPV